MRTFIGKILAALVCCSGLCFLGASLATLLAPDSMRFTPLIAIGLSAKWPLPILILSYYSAPPETDSPANLRKHKDRNWFAGALTAIAAVLLLLFLCQVTLR